MCDQKFHVIFFFLSMFFFSAFNRRFSLVNGSLLDGAGSPLAHYGMLLRELTKIVVTSYVFFSFLRSSPPPPPSAFFFFFFFGRSMEIITWESVEEILRHRIAFGSREDKKTSILFVCFYHHRDERPDWLPGMASLPLASFNQSQSNQEYFKVKLIFKVTSTCYFRS